MNFVFLDIYKDSKTRITKDTAGGYGTENKLGNGLFARFAERLIRHGVFWPNLSFIHAATELHHRGHTVSYEKNVYTICGDFLTKANVNDVDLIFLCSSLVCFETEIEAARSLLKRNQNVPIVLLGQTAIELIEEIPSQLHIIGGNYEFLFASKKRFSTFLSDIKQQRQVVRNSDFTQPVALNKIAWDIFGGGFDNKIFIDKKNYPLISSRGCPYSCIEYCSYPISQGRKVIVQDIDETLRQLKHINAIDVNGHVVFRDPVFTINRPRVLQLMQAIANADLSLTYTVELHLKTCDEQIIKGLKQMRTTHVKFGIESSSDYVRAGSYRYSVSNDKQKEIISILKRNEILTDGMFILGMPDDDFQTVEATINYACSLDLDYAQFSVFTPYPGTQSFTKMANDFTIKRYEDLNQFSLQFKHKKLSKTQIDRLLYKAYAKFYRRKIFRLLGLFK